MYVCWVGSKGKQQAVAAPWLAGASQLDFLILWLCTAPPPHSHTSIYIKHFKLQMWNVSPEYWRSAQKIAKTTHAGGAILICLAVMSSADEDREFRALSQFRQDKYLWNIIIVLDSTDGRLGAGRQRPQPCYSGKLRWIQGSGMIGNDSSEIRLKSREDDVSKWKSTKAPRPSERGERRSM